MPGLINALAPLMTPYANVAGAIGDLGDSIQRDNQTAEEAALRREQMAAETKRHEETIAAENERAKATIEEAKRAQAAGFGEKRREQRAAAVKDFTDSVLMGDPARLEASAPYLAAHGISLEQGYDAGPPVPDTTAAPNAPMSAMGMVDQILATPAPGDAAAPAPTPGRHVIKLRAGDEDLGNIDVTSIGEQRAAAIKPVLDRLLAGAAPKDRAAYQQQISAAQQSPAMMAMGAPKLVEAINKGAQPNAAQEHADYRALINASAQRDRAGGQLDLGTWRVVNLQRQRVLAAATKQYNVPELNKTELAAEKVDHMLKLHPELETGAGDIEAMEGQIRATLGGSVRIGPELLEATMRRAGFSGESKRKLLYFIDGGKLPPEMIKDAVKISRAMREDVHRRRIEAAATAHRAIMSDSSLQQLLDPATLKEEADSTAQQVGNLSAADAAFLDATLAPPAPGGADATP